MTNHQELGTPYKKGLYRRGGWSVEDFLRDHATTARGLGISDSELRVLTSVSRNEGKLDALNTWDNSFLSFGMFQWTAGTGSNPGELAGLLHQLGQTNAECFREYFGRHGLGVSMTGPHTGFLLLNGKALRTPAQKETLRNSTWAKRFVLAAHDPRVAACQLAHAVARLEQFYFTRQTCLDGCSLSDLFTSEYAVALLLDHHVNRPGHFPKHVARALEKAGIEPGPLAGGDDALERRAIDAYLRHRETTSMTDAKKRARRMRNDVGRGALSDMPHSFATGTRTQG